MHNSHATIHYNIPRLLQYCMTIKTNWKIIIVIQNLTCFTRQIIDQVGLAVLI